MCVASMLNGACQEPIATWSRDTHATNAFDMRACRCGLAIDVWARGGVARSGDGGSLPEIPGLVCS